MILFLILIFYLRVGAKRFANKPYLGTRAFLEGGKRGAYEWITYAQCHARWTNLASGLVELGVKKVKEKREVWRIARSVLFGNEVIPVRLLYRALPLLALGRKS
jgi:hypothetical protein